MSEQNQTLIDKYNIDVLSVLSSLPTLWDYKGFTNNIIIQKWWTQLQVCCPFHNDNTPSLWISITKNSYNCFVCSWSNLMSKVLQDKPIWHWNIINFVRFYYEICWNIILSDQQLCDIFNIDVNQRQNFLNDINHKYIGYKNNDDKKTSKNIIQTKYKFSILQNSDYSWGPDTYLQQRLHKDINDNQYNKTISHFYLSTNKNGDIIIPIIFNHNLIGINCRLNQTSHTMKYRDLLSFKRDGVIYHWDHIKDLDEIILVEGPLNAIRLWSLGYKNVGSFFWTMITNQTKKLLQWKKKITLWFDQNSSWKTSSEQLKQYLELHWTIVTIITPFDSHIQWNENKDVFDYTAEEILLILNQ